MPADLDWQLEPATRLADLAEDWNAINAADTTLPILDAAFWLTALDCFGTGRERLLLARAGDTPVAAGLFGPASRVSVDLFQPSQAPLGPWIRRPEAPTDLPASLRQRLGCTVLGLSQQDPRLHPVPAAGEAEVLPYIQTAAVDVAGDFASYWEQRGKNLRQNLRKQRNRLEREGVQTRLVELRDPGQMAAAIDAYAALEQSGWKADEGTAVTATGDQGQFYEQIFSHYATRGEARIYQYWFDDRLVTCDLCLVRNGTVIILKTAYDASIKKLSPAFLLKEELFRQYFDGNEIRRVEFYGRLMDWHTKWTGDIRELYHANYTSGLGRLLRRLRGQTASA